VKLGRFKITRSLPAHSGIRRVNVKIESTSVFKRKSLSAVIGLAAIGALSQVPAHAEGLVLEEIIVTAQKRAESVQDIPVAVTAVQGDTLDKMGIKTFSDLTKVSPSLTLRQGANKNNSPISLRGVGTNAYSMGVEPSVAVIIDDVPVARSAQAFSNLVDVERIEVLRGPQSTLFGKSSSAGVISITTKAPSDEFEADFEYSKIIGNENRASGSLSGRLTDTVSVRASGYYSDVDGHIENITDGKDLNGGVNKGGRAKIVWEASDDLLVTFIGDYNESDEDCCAAPLNYVADGALLGGFIPDVAWLPSINPSGDNTDVRFDTTPKSTSHDWSGTLRMEYSLGDYTLSSITGYRDWNYAFQRDLDSSDVQPFGAPILLQSSASSTKLLTQEFRINSPSFDNYEYVAGIWYSKAESERTFERGPLTFNADWDAETESESMAIFGQVKFNLTEQWTLITGLRYNHEEVSVGYHRTIPTVYDLDKASDIDEVVTGKLALQYFVNEDVMLFGGYSRGYKGQGYDVSSSFSPFTAASPVAPESSDAFELGVKTTLLDGRAQLNVVLFTTEYQDFQAQAGTIDPNTGAAELKLNNVGDLETTGVEIDATMLITENFQMQLGLAYIDAQITSFEDADCYALQTAAQGCVNNKQDLSGEDLNNSPDLKVTLAGEYTLALESMPFDGFMNFSYQWQDDLHFDLLNDPALKQDAYGIFNLNVGIDSEEDGYRVTLFANNLFDQNYLASMVQNQAIYGGADVRSHQIPRGAQREVGIRFNMSF
jgi:iron complex outermembrane recepter protein